MEQDLKLRKKKKIAIITLFIIFGLIILYFILFQSPIFKINTIDIVGNKNISYNDLMRMTGLKKGTSIFKVDETGMENKIKESPYVENVSVNVIYPSKVFIKVDERKIVAQISFNDKYLYIDTNGVVIKASSLDKNLPIISGINVNKYEIGKKINALYENNDMAKLLPIIYNKNIYKKIDVNNDNVTLTTKEGISIVLENVNSISYSMKFSELILEDLKKKGLNSGIIKFEGNGNPVYLHKNGG